MSTRGAVAFATESGWSGVYNHSDSYPTGLGKEIWDIIHEKFLNNEGKLGIKNKLDPENALNAFINVYIKGHKGGWSCFGDVCYCHDPSFVLRDGDKTERELMTEKDNDALFIEWVYIINPKTKTMKVLSSYDTGEKKVVEVKDRKYTEAVYSHQVIVEVDLLGEEPDWESIENKEVNDECMANEG